MQFDIDEFYPSIPKELSQKAINRTSTFSEPTSKKLM